MTEELDDWTERRARFAPVERSYLASPDNDGESGPAEGWAYADPESHWAHGVPKCLAHDPTALHLDWAWDWTAPVAPVRTYTRQELEAFARERGIEISGAK